MGAPEATTAGKSVIVAGYRHTVESPRAHYPDAELWMQSTSIRNWDWSLYNWSRWFDIHTVDHQTYYPGIRLQRPDVLAWYMKQGPERPIYLCQHEPSIPGSVAYPIAAVEAAFPEGIGRFGCQVDYMIALALLEGVTRIILYGVGQPYVADPNGEKARKWFKFHGTALWWIGFAQARGVEIVYDGPNMLRPHEGRYGYDMGVSAAHYQAIEGEGHPFART